MAVCAISPVSHTHDPAVGPATISVCQPCQGMDICNVWYTCLSCKGYSKSTGLFKHQNSGLSTVTTASPISEGQLLTVLVSFTHKY